MISRSDPAAAGRSGRLLRFSLALSLLVHLVVLLLAFGTFEVLERVLPHHLQRPVKRDDETVTLSTALHFERRPRAAFAQPNGAAASAVRPPARVEQKLPAAARLDVTARPVARAKPLPRKPQRVPPRELAKTVPRTTPQPQAKRVAATAPPHAPQRQVALVQHAAAANAEPRPDRASLSAARLAQIQSDLAASIAHDRARENPLSNVARRLTPAATTRRFAIDVAGTRSLLRGAQGLCTPSQTWTMDGFIYFYVTCRTQRADGSVRNEVIPWPIRFRPYQVVYGPSGPAPPAGEIPLPLPGWKLSATQYVDPDVLDFLRERRAAAIVGAEARQ